MKSVQYYVCTCLECNSMLLFKIEFMDFNKECCLDFKNIRVMKIFYDEQEANNYLKLHRKDEE